MTIMRRQIVWGIALACALAIVLLFGCAPEPKTYSDCVLRYMKPHMNKFASAQVCRACRAKFHAPTEEETLAIYQEEVARLEPPPLHSSIREDSTGTLVSDDENDPDWIARDRALKKATERAALRLKAQSGAAR